MTESHNERIARMLIGFSKGDVIEARARLAADRPALRCGDQTTSPDAWEELGALGGELIDMILRQSNPARLEALQLIACTVGVSLRQDWAGRDDDGDQGDAYERPYLVVENSGHGKLGRKLLGDVGGDPGATPHLTVVTQSARDIG